MPTKSDRILSYLPGTFRRAPDRSVLFAIVDAFGSELLKGENSLAAVMQAHWVDHADRGADVIDDLARIASLYGLKPRCQEPEENGGTCTLPPLCDETVEEFREHLKRYVLTFLEGTVTVQGLLRVAAENLGLHIADEYEEMDTWWDRDHDELVTIHPHPDDAAQYLLGFREAAAAGTAAQPAQVRGTENLSGAINLGESAVLSLSVDDGDPVDVDLLDGAADPEAVNLDWIVVTVNVALGQQVATHDGRHLSLTSPSIGEDSRLEIYSVEGDASEQLLGIKRRGYRGSEGLPAAVTGSRDLRQGVDLSERSHILVSLDGADPVLIDCAGADPANTRPGEIVAAINKHFESTVARTDGNRISLFSSTTGPESTILFGRPPFSDATERIFGIGPHLFGGEAATAASISGEVALDESLSFLAQRRLHLVIDGERAELDLRALATNPRSVSLEILAPLINTALRRTLATLEDDRLVLTSLTKGDASSLAVEAIELTRRRRFVTRAKIVDEAAQAVFGFIDREAQGQEATSARLVGKKDLSRAVDLSRKRMLRLAVDSQPPVEVDCAGPRPRATLPDEIVGKINSHFDSDVAYHDAGKLILASPTVGESSRIAVETPDDAESDARTLLLGSVQDEVQGSAAVPAVIEGEVDLLTPADLSERSLLRIAVNGRRPIDIDIAGTTPSSTTLDQILAAINASIPGLASATDDDRLRLTAPGSEVESRLELLPLRYLEVVEYLPEPEEPLTVQARHGQRWAVINGGAADALTEVTLQNRSGVAGPGLVNGSLGWYVRWLNALSPGAVLRISPDPERGVRLQIESRKGTLQDVPGAEVLVGPLGAQAIVPFTGKRPLSGGGAQAAALQLNNPDAPWLVRLRAREPGAGGRSVAVAVTASAGGPALFDVTLRLEEEGATEGVEEHYAAVSIGRHPNEVGSLTWEINAGPNRSSLVTAEIYRKEIVLNLPQGRSDWRYLSCHTSRFDDPASRFDEASFAGGRCREPGIFDVSRFASRPADEWPDPVLAVFAGQSPDGPETEIVFDWTVHRPGTVQVNLPLDLPARFGGRFDKARFGQRADSPELYSGVVVEPEDDADHLLKRIGEIEHSLVKVEKAATVDLGWEAVAMPFRQPQFLTLGRADGAARLYLSEEGLDGFILIRAREPGAWGNEIAVSARLTGPARYDVCIVYRGSVYENATVVVAGQPAPVLSAEMLAASPVGVLQAKAAGVRAGVTRDKEGVLAEEMSSKR